MDDINGNPAPTATDTEGSKDYDVSNFLKSIEEKIPEGADPVEYFKQELTTAEKRRRGTVAGFTKSQQALKAAEAQINFLRDKVVSTINLTPEQVKELEELKYRDPDAWRAKLDSYESQSKAKFDTDVKAELERIKNLSVEEFEKERIANQLKEFVAANPELDITRPEIADQIPPLYMRQLANGQISFGEFLELAKRFITSPNKTAAADTPAPSGTDANATRGDSKAPISKEESNVLDRQKTLKF